MIELGKVYKVKEESKEACESFFRNPRSHFIRFREKDWYEILDSNRYYLDTCTCITEDRLEPRSLDSLDVGDVVKDDMLMELTVMGVTGRVFFLSFPNDPKRSGHWTTLETIKKDYTLKGTEEPQDRVEALIGQYAKLNYDDISMDEIS